MSNFSDKTIKCAFCGSDFVFTANEQKFYQEHEFSEPKRCKSCRDKKKQQKELNK